MAQIFTDQDFDAEVLKAEGLVLVDFFAEWCGPCKMLAPIIDALSEGYNGKIVFGKLNVDENREISAKYSVMSIPTLLIFKNKTLMETVVGAVSKEQLKEKLGKYL